MNYILDITNKKLFGENTPVNVKSLRIAVDYFKEAVHMIPTEIKVTQEQWEEYEKGLSDFSVTLGYDVSKRVHLTFDGIPLKI